MLKPIRKSIRWLMTITGIYSVYLLRKKSYLQSKDWFASHRLKKSMGAGGVPLPWFTYPAIHFLEPRLNKELRVFEYGSGASTIWFSERVKNIESVEHNWQWYQHAQTTKIANANITYCDPKEPGKYYSSIEMSGGLFDIIVIDGIEREMCAKISTSYLSPTGIIILDNSDKKEHEAIYRLFEDLEYRWLDFAGMGPCNTYEWQTTIFYKDNNCLGI